MLRTALTTSRLALRARVTTPSLAHPHRLFSSTRPQSQSDDELTTATHYWPVTKVNTILNLCSQGETMIVERLGSLHRVYQPGWFLSIPILDHVAYRVDMRERPVYYPPQRSITKDNVTVDVGAVIFVRFDDPIKAAYGATDPLAAIQELAKSAMRSTVGEMELDEVFHSRKKVNERCCDAVAEAAANWGLVVTRHEILDVTPDRHISESLDKQAAAERLRREKVLQAEGEKQAASLESQGVKIRLTNESEGHLARVRNEALAEQTKLELEAQGEARAIVTRAEAHAEALERVAKALSEHGGSEAARLAIAREYISMYGEMAKGSNTIMMNDKPADVAALITQATLALGAANTLGAASTLPQYEAQQ